MTKKIKVRDKDYWKLFDATYFKHVLFHFKNGKKKKYFIIDTDWHEDNDEDKNMFVYMTSHDKDPQGMDRYSGNGINFEDVDYIEMLD